MNKQIGFYELPLGAVFSAVGQSGLWLGIRVQKKLDRFGRVTDGFVELGKLDNSGFLDVGPVRYAVDNTPRDVVDLTKGVKILPDQMARVCTPEQGGISVKGNDLYINTFYLSEVQGAGAQPVLVERNSGRWIDQSYGDFYGNGYSHFKGWKLCFSQPGYETRVLSAIRS